MSQDILNFTKMMSGIDLVEYVINYIDQNNIMYGLLGGLDHEIKTSKENEATIVYNLVDLSDSKKENVYMVRESIKDNHILSIYGINYYIDISDDMNDNFIIKICQHC